MIIIDTALKKRERENNPIRVGIIGTGFLGKGITLTVESSIPGMIVAALSNRTLSEAKKAYEQAEISDYKEVDRPELLDRAIREGERAVTDDPMVLCRASEIDVIIEATGEVEFGASVVLEAIRNRKHVVLINAELDATIGPVLKAYADEHGVIYTNADGDQPGVLMNLYRFVETIGYRPVLAGNIKGMLDPYRTPETQKEFAIKYNQNPKMVTSFADGTKLSMEMAVVANATGFHVSERGMHGPACEHVDESPEHFRSEDMLNGGVVDYVLGAEPGPGVFVIGYNNHPIRKEYMPVFKMGKGPYYVFYVPYHLPHLEAPLTAARAVLFNDATITPIGAPVCEVVAIAKRNLQPGTVLDGIGGFTCYGQIENFKVSQKENLLPMGLIESAVLKNGIPKDQPLTWSDVEVPHDRLSLRLWKEQNSRWNETQLKKPLSV